MNLNLYIILLYYLQCQVIMALTDLLRNYSAVEWPRYKSTLQSQRENSERLTPTKSDRKN